MKDVKTMRKKALLAVLMLLVLIMLTACGGKQNQENAGSQSDIPSVSGTTDKPSPDSSGAGEVEGWMKEDMLVVNPQTDEEYEAAFEAVYNINESAVEYLEQSGITELKSTEALDALYEYLRTVDAVKCAWYGTDGLFYMTNTGLVCQYNISETDEDISGVISPETAWEKYCEEDYVFLHQSFIPDPEVMTNRNIRLVVLDEMDGTMRWIYDVAKVLLQDFSDRIDGSFVHSLALQPDLIFSSEYSTDSGFFEFAAHGGYNFGRLYLQAMSLDASNAKSFRKFDQDADTQSWIAALFAGTQGFASTSSFIFNAGVLGKEVDGYISYEPEKKHSTMMIAATYLTQNCWDGSRFDNTVVFLDVCHAAEDMEFIHFFLDNGASAVVCERGSGWRVTEQLNVLAYLTSEMAEGKSIPQALSDARDPGTQSRVRNRRASLVKDIDVDYRYNDSSGIAVDQWYNTEMDGAWEGTNRLGSDDATMMVYMPFTTHIMNGAGKLQGSVLNAKGRHVPIPGVDVSFYRWLNHDYLYVDTVTTDKQGSYEIENLPYGYYVIKAETEGKESWCWVKHFEPETEADTIYIDMDLVKELLVSASGPYHTSGGYDFRYAVHVIGENGDHLLSRKGDMSTFSIAGENIDEVRFRVWQHDERTVFIEHAQAETSDWSEQLTYALYRLNRDDEFVCIKKAQLNGVSFNRETRSAYYDNTVYLYESGELVGEAEYTEDVWECLEKFFATEEITFGESYTVNGEDRGELTPSFTYRLANDPGGKLKYDSEYDRKKLYSEDEIKEMYYVPMRVRETTEKEQGINVLFRELGNEFSTLTNTSSHKNDDGTYQVTYSDGSNFSIVISADAKGRVTALRFSDSDFYNSDYLRDTDRFAPSDYMRRFYETVSNSQGLELEPQTLATLRAYDYDGSATITEGDFVMPNQRKYSEATLGGVRVVYLKENDYAAGDWMTSELRIELPADR